MSMIEELNAKKAELEQELNRLEKIAKEQERAERELQQERDRRNAEEEKYAKYAPLMEEVALAFSGSVVTGGLERQNSKDLFARIDGIAKGDRCLPYDYEKDVETACLETLFGGAMFYKMVVGRLEITLVYGPTVFRGSAWHGHHEKVAEAEIRVDKGRKTIKRFRLSSWDKNLQAFGDRAAKAVNELITEELEKEDAEAKKKRERAELLQNIVKLAWKRWPKCEARAEYIWRAPYKWQKQSGYIETDAVRLTVKIGGKSTEYSNVTIENGQLTAPITKREVL